jgi:tetratricopeptide (TPR) repeat protein
MDVEDRPGSQPYAEAEDPEWVSEQISQGNYHLLENNFMKSFNIFQNLWELGVKHPGVFHNIGLCLELLGRFEDALKHYTANMKNFPEYIRSYLGAYNCLMYLGQHDEAGQVISAVMEKVDTFPQSNILAAEYLLQTGVKDYNMTAIQLHIQTFQYISQYKAIQTTNYAQCYYESFGDSVYYLWYEGSFLANPIQTMPFQNLPASNTVVMFVVNHGYMDIARNCFESIRRHCPEVLEQTVLVCLDQESYDIFESLAHPAHVYKFDGLVSHNATIGLYNTDYFNKLVMLKFYFTQLLLAGGKNVVVSDLDIVWLKNPLSYLESQVGSKEMLIQRDRGPGGDEDILCSGFMYIRPSHRTMTMFDYKNISPLQGGEQPSVNFLIHTLCVPHTVLPDTTFPNGTSWYEGIAKDPYIVHYNYVVGFDKVHTMKKYSHWFIVPNDVQSAVLEETLRWRVDPHVSAGRDFAGPWIENVYFNHWMCGGRHAPALSAREAAQSLPTNNVEHTSIYLPIFWTDVFVQYPEALVAVQEYINALDKTYSYYTVLQNSNGLGVTIPDGLDLRVFTAGTYAVPGAKTVCIPLLKKEVVKSPQASETGSVIFAGSLNGYSDYKKIRSSMAAIAIDNGWKLYNGPQWVREMSMYRFSLCPRGFGPTSFRLAESIQMGLVPIIIWDEELFLPYPDLNWSLFSIIVHASKMDTLPERVQIAPVQAMQEELLRVQHMFTYDYVCEYIASSVAAQRGQSPLTRVCETSLQASVLAIHPSGACGYQRERGLVC